MNLHLLALTSVLALSVASQIFQRPASAGTILGVSTEDVDPLEMRLFARNLPFGRLEISESLGQDPSSNLITSEGLLSDFIIADTDLENLEKINSQISEEFGVTINHFNWLQVVTSNNLHYTLRDRLGNPVITPFVDLPAGGFPHLWADDIPWYLNESPPPPGIPSNSLSGFLDDFTHENGGVSFLDYPTGLPGNIFTFDTFLIADFGNRTYDVIMGFSWAILVRTNGTFHDRDGNGVWTGGEPFEIDDNSPYKAPVFVSDVFSIQPGTTWKPFHEGLVYSDFGYTRQKIEEDGIVKHPLSTIIVDCAEPQTERVWVPRRRRVKVGGSGGGGFKTVDGGYWKEVEADSDCKEEHFSAVDDPGFYQQNPRLEDQTLEEWKEFFGIPSYLWADPVTTYGLEFQALGDTLFTDIFNFPTGLDADELFTVVVDGTVIGEFSPGEWVDFTEDFGEGVSTFQILGIDPLDGAEATDIPFQLAFNDQTGSFRVRALSPTDVPDPSSVLGIFTFGLLGWTWQRQRGK